MKQYAEGLAQSLTAINAAPVAAPGGGLAFISALPSPASASSWGPDGECSALIAENTEAQRWADQQAKEQGLRFTLDSAGVTAAVDGAKQGAVDATVRRLGVEDLKQTFDATKERLEQARTFKAFMERVEACVGPAKSGKEKSGCLVALAAETSDEPAKEWLKGLLDDGTRGAFERAEKAGKIYQQYVQRLEATYQKQALTAARCR